METVHISCLASSKSKQSLLVIYNPTTYALVDNELCMSNWSSIIHILLYFCGGTLTTNRRNLAVLVVCPL